MRDEAAHPLFADAGYAAIRVDQRGCGDSEGVMLDEYADIETDDGVSVIEWIAAQDWCDGGVGMFGKSWGAYNSFQVAARRPPALKAIAPVMGTDDRWLEDIHFYGGVLASDNFWWGSIMQLYNAMPPDPAIVGDRWRDMWKERLDAMTYWPAQWMEHQTHDEMWRRGSSRRIMTTSRSRFISSVAGQTCSATPVPDRRKAEGASEGADGPMGASLPA